MLSNEPLTAPVSHFLTEIWLETDRETNRQTEIKVTKNTSAAMCTEIYIASLKT